MHLDPRRPDTSPKVPNHKVFTDSILGIVAMVLVRYHIVGY